MLRIIVALFAVALMTVSSAPGRAAPATFRDCADHCPEMVVIPGGEFQMGFKEDDPAANMVDRVMSPAHRVTVRSFALAIYPVTRAEYRTFVEDSGHRGDAGCMPFFKVPDEDPRLSWQEPGYFQTERDPVVCVDWTDAQSYVLWLSQRSHQKYRLPSEAEWEYAARARTATNQFWGSNREGACRYANIRDLRFVRNFELPQTTDHFPCDDGYAYTSPVGSFLPNAFGAYDMLGNVQQWTQDCPSIGYRGVPTDGAPFVDSLCLAHVIRGTNPSNRSDMGAPDRTAWSLTSRHAELGFRVARDLRSAE